eukprot:4916866-Amphidinium_carterae.7
MRATEPTRVPGNIAQKPYKVKEAPTEYFYFLLVSILQSTHPFIQSIQALKDKQASWYTCFKSGHQGHDEVLGRRLHRLSGMRGAPRSTAGKSPPGTSQ